MPITRTPILDDNGTGTTGTILNNAWKTEFYNQIDGVTAGTTVDNVLSATGGAIVSTVESRLHVLYMTNTTPVTVTGFSAPNSLYGDRLMILSVFGSADTLLSYTNTANQFRNWVTSAPTPIKSAPGGMAQYIRSGSGSWLMTDHEQGGWRSDPFTATAFGSSAGAWTVDPGDVASLAYRLSGNTLTVAFQLATTSVPSAAATLNLTNAMWGGFTIGPLAVFNPLAYVNDAGATTPGAYASATAALSYLTLSKANGANWAVSTNGTYLYGQITFPVA